MYELRVKETAGDGNVNSEVVSMWGAFKAYDWMRSLSL